MKTKKALERKILQHFMELAQLSGCTKIAEREEPDFTIEISGYAVGIELTTLYLDQPTHVPNIQQGEVFRRRICERAASLCVERRLPNLEVSVHFSLNHRAQRYDPERLAEWLAQFISEEVPPEGEWRWFGYPHTHDLRIPEQISAVSIGRFASLDRMHVSSAEAGFVPALSIADVERAIASKERRLSAYRVACPVVWLVISIDVGSRATMFSVPEGFFANRFQYQFDQVYLVSHLFGWARRLPASESPMVSDA